MTGQSLRLTTPDELPAPRTDSEQRRRPRRGCRSPGELRTPYWLSDSAVAKHARPRQIIAEAQNMLLSAVAAARDQNHTWAEIGQLTNLSAATAARRYRGHS